MPAAAQIAVRPDTTDMHAIHAAFRRNFGDARALIESARDPERVEVVRNFFDNLLKLLHVHHAAEDELMFPLLAERCPDSDTVARIASQHNGVNAALQTADAALEAWSLEDATSAARLRDAMAALATELGEHLAEEERFVLPLAAEHMSVEEWSAMPGHAMRAFTGDKMWVVLGSVRENMTQEQRDVMLASMPPPVVEMWTASGFKSYTDLMRELREPHAAL